MKTKLLPFLFAIMLVAILSSCNNEVKEQPITPGADRMSEYLPMIEDKSVALAVNNSSLVNGVPILDTLLSEGVDVVKVFGPEHGFRGGNNYDSVDVKTGVPVVSLYKSGSYKPSAEDLADVDVMIFDMQDVGTRFYTYLSTLHYVMEACAENDKQLIILDRPNPNDYYIDGPILDTNFRSFVGMHPIPILHALTLGEYAHMINGEKWLRNGIQCDITVIEVANYEHGKPYELPVDPSPNLNTHQSILLYPSLCLFEGTVISQGRGTEFPFQVLGNPLLSEHYEFSFTPVPMEGMSMNPPHKDNECFGLDLRNYDTSIFRETGKINLSWLLGFYEIYPDKENFFHVGRFDRLAGGDHLRNQIINGSTEEEIRQSWEPGLNLFRSIRKNYLLYKDFY
jgi:uncharacterized protein YbbC (DUF1343 family)